jgi:pSer/pThr/pTyr-binding forkhead associated (FHA) protein
MEAVLRIVTRGGEKIQVPEGEEVILGRGENCDVRFAEDATVSPKHARLLMEDGGLYVVDLGAVNGVFVRVKDPVLLETKDRIRLGDHIFSFEVIPWMDVAKANITKVHGDPSTEVIGTKGEIAKARLIINLDTGHRGKEYFIGETTIVLGNGDGTHNFLSDPKISRKHAKITPREQGGFMLADLDSAEGTWRQTRGRVNLTPGQEVLIGHQRLIVESVPA